MGAAAVSDDVVVICLPTDGFAPRIPGCTREYCEVCATEVWCSPESKKLATKFLCIDCAPGVMATEADAHIEMPSAGQIREIAEHWP
jgi:hypothetical protein